MSSSTSTSGPRASRKRTGAPGARAARLLVALLLGLALAPAARAQQSQKLGFVDSSKIIEATPGVTEAKASYEKQAEAWRTELLAKQKELNDLQEEYKKQAAILSPEKKTEKQQEMLTLEQEIQQYFQAKFGQEGEAAAKQAELMKPIIDRVNDVIEQTRREGSYALIFDLNDGALVAGDPALNITQQVIDRLRAQPAPSR